MDGGTETANKSSRKLSLTLPSKQGQVKLASGCDTGSMIWVCVWVHYSVLRDVIIPSLPLGWLDVPSY